MAVIARHITTRGPSYALIRRAGKLAPEIRPEVTLGLELSIASSNDHALRVDFVGSEGSETIAVAVADDLGSYEHVVCLADPRYANDVRALGPSTTDGMAECSIDEWRDILNRQTSTELVDNQQPISAVRSLIACRHEERL